MHDPITAAALARTRANIVERPWGQSGDAARFDAAIGSAPNFASAMERFEEAVRAGVNVADMLAVQGERIA